MLVLIAAALIQALPAQGQVPVRTEADRCRGIHMPDGGEGVNLIWTTFRGPEVNLRDIGSRMQALGARIEVGGESGSPAELLVSYWDDLDVRAIAGVLNDTDAGRFGPVTTDDFAMDIATLPADKCIRFTGTP